MKKIFALLFTFIFIFALASCDKNKGGETVAPPPLPEINEDFHVGEDGTIHGPIIDYTK